jgi:hypothetical protein
MLNFYEEHHSFLIQEQKNLEKTFKKISAARLITILIGMVSIVKAFEISGILGSIVLILFILGFFYLVKFYEKIEDKINLNKNEQLLIENEIQVLKLPNTNVYYDGEVYKNGAHSFSEDLDLFGKGSLFHFINRANTNKGIERLKSGFLNIEEDSEKLKTLHAICEELNQKNDWRLKFQASLWGLKNHEKVVAIEKLPLPPNLKFASFIKFYGKLLPVIWIILLAIGGIWFLEYIGYMIFGMFIFNFWLGGINKKLTSEYLQQVAVSGKTLESFDKAVGLILAEKFSNVAIQNLVALLPLQDTNNKNPIHEFLNIIKRIEIRKNLLASFFIGIFKPFESIETIKLGQWLSKNPEFFKKIFEVVGSFEFYSSLGSLKFNHPEWVFPVFKNEKDTFLIAQQMGHPLILRSQAVCNDFELSKNNLLNIITGSNMSGKSTFLRTLGINAVLANLGGPVFAQYFELKVGLKPVCYMRITDSLQQNSSTFKAEIERIKLVLKAIESDETNLFLIDEMLRGTNSEDKIIGSMALLRKIALSKVPALVATHDLRLAEISEEFPGQVKNYYFEYQSNQGDLSFDYLIKEGICNSFNASLLLQSIGLDMKSK